MLDWRARTCWPLGRDPAAPAQAVAGGLGEGKLEGCLAALRQLARDAERLAVVVQIGEGLVVHRQVQMARPWTLGVCIGILETERAQLLVGGARRHLLRGHRSLPNSATPDRSPGT